MHAILNRCLVSLDRCPHPGLWLAGCGPQLWSVSWVRGFCAKPCSSLRYGVEIPSAHFRTFHIASRLWSSSRLSLPQYWARNVTSSCSCRPMAHVSPTIPTYADPGPKPIATSPGILPAAIQPHELPIIKEIDGSPLATSKCVGYHRRSAPVAGGIRPSPPIQSQCRSQSGEPRSTD
jgi:hypothetical protein